MFKTKSYDLQTKKIEMRNLQDQISAGRKELVSLTTGLVVRSKKERSARLRSRVRLIRRSVVAIQSLWRRALVRTGLRDEAREYWIECVDEEQGDAPYYYNTWTQQTAWKVPLGYKYFCRHKA